MNDDLKKEIYEDVFQPATKEIGLTVGSAVKVMLAPLNGLIWGFDKIEKWVGGVIEKKLSNVDPSKIITPDATVAGPLIENLRFAGSKDELKEMYANLLAKAMNLDTKNEILPSFVEIVKQLSDLDVKILESIRNNNFDNRLADIKGNVNGGGFHLLFKNLTVNQYTNFSEDEISIALDNLERLHILELTHGTYVNISYDDFKQTSVYQSRELACKISNLTIELEKRKSEITSFGNSFLKAIGN